ncbi:hypothetical protein GCM10027030_12740 [Luteococcus sediminum]|uniref:type I polyketide synthase n=1 Tax=Luteococcus sp. TaxID=1969402 RepID=UPI0037355938
MQSHTELKARLQNLQSGPVAVVGMACRFPGGVRTPQDLWDLMVAGQTVIDEVPEDRWDLEQFYSSTPQLPGKTASRFGGFLDDVDIFDHEFFGISRREAEAMDPQHRLFLETSWEALELAGCTMQSLAGSQTGVCATLSGADHAGLAVGDIMSINAYTGIGSAHSIGAGRLSYLLDLHGPCMVLDAACASSLVSVHEACGWLRRREADMVICGAASTMLTPVGDITLSQLSQSFASDGETKSFAADADGFVRSEGVGVLVLKRLEDAEQAGDNILAVVRGSGVNHDGRSAGLTAPNGAMQAAVMHEALRCSGVDPNDVALIETHGTGTVVGDPIEVEALRQVYGRTSGLPLYLGAVKTNLGHAEAAAGMAGLIKAVLCLQRGAIPPNRGQRKASPLLPLEGTSMQIPNELIPWPAAASRRIAAVSSFGLNGTNAHLILEAPAPRASAGQEDLARPRLFAVTARTPKALRKLARRFQDQLREGSASYTDFAFTASSRTPWEQRTVVLARTNDEAAQLLDDVIRGRASSPAVWQATSVARPRAVAFLFPGTGAHYAGMGSALAAASPVFAEHMNTFDAMMRDLAGVSLTQIMWPQNDHSRLGEPQFASPALYALQMSLAATWQSWGIIPDAVLGHSVGEYAAMATAGVISPDSGFELVVRRAALMAELPPGGAMIGVNAALETLQEIIADLPTGEISVAGVNGPANITLSGTAQAVEEARQRCEAQGMHVMQIDSDRAGHSPLVEPVLPALAALQASHDLQPTRLPLVLGATGSILASGTALPSGYLATQTREAVRFADGVKTLATIGCGTFVEIGPGADALGMALDSLDAEAKPLMVPSLRRRRPEDEAILAAVARLFVHGHDPRWEGVFDGSGARKVPAPTYPFDRIELGRRRLTAQPDQPRSSPEPAVADRSAADPLMQGPLQGTAGQQIIMRQELLDSPEDLRRDKLLDSLKMRLRHSLGFSSAIPVDVPLTFLGLDSLMAIELRNEISSNLGVEIDMTEFLRGTTLEDIASSLVVQVDTERAAGPVPDEPEISPLTSVDEDLLTELLAQVENEGQSPTPEANA